MMMSTWQDAAPNRNLERKARHTNLVAAAAAVVQFGATFLATETQTDTYFHVPRGRLKLREIEGQPGALIWYDRPNRSEARLGTYHLVPVADAAGLKAALTAALGVRVVVRKRRTIYLWHNVRIHLDEVEGLGTFIEFEAVLAPIQDKPTAHNRLAELAEVLGIHPGDYLATSYSDLLGF